MCGIVGYIGERQAQPILLSCMARLEYRGYDSSGLALAGPEIQVYKDAVKVSELGKTLPQILRAPFEYCVHAEVSVDPVKYPRITNSMANTLHFFPMVTFGSGISITVLRHSKLWRCLFGIRCRETEGITPGSLSLIRLQP